MEKFITNTPTETSVIAELLAARLCGGEVVALYGNLGAGKTTFVQALAKALGIRKRVQSPTFILMQEYPIEKKGSITTFLHVDAYRADDAQLAAVGLPEYLGRPDTVVLIEWADRAEALLPDKTIAVRLAHLGGDRREITLGS